MILPSASLILPAAGVRNRQNVKPAKCNTTVSLMWPLSCLVPTSPAARQTRLHVVNLCSE